MSEMTVVGKYIPSINALSKVTGQNKMLQDMKMPGMLYGKVFRSTQVHARIRKIDVSKARKLPGVRAVITAADIPPRVYCYSPDSVDEEILCSKKVRYIGDEIAAVAADSVEIAQEALKLIEVEYEPLPGTFDTVKAMESNAPLVHEDKGSNIVGELDKEFGDIEKGFAESDHIFEDYFVSSRQAHCCMETRGCIAQYAAGGSYTIWAPTQGPHNTRTQLAEALGIDKSKVRVIDTAAGGAFGQKVMLDTNVPIAAYLSKFTGRPVKLVNTREEEFFNSRTSYEFKVYLKTGVTEEGKILAKQARVILDNGAYTDQGFNMVRFAGVVFSVLYDVPNIKYQGSLVYTNNQPSTAFRGFGNQQINFAFEAHLDQIAAKLGLDPMEIRLLNANKTGYTKATKAFINTCPFKECIEETARLSGWAEKRKLYDKQDKNKRFQRGIGMAMMTHTGCSTRNGGFLAGEAFIKISEDGIVSLITPIVELGQGGTTAMTQIVAEGMGVKMEDVRIINADTEVIPFDPGAFGSRQTFIDGHAALAAALDAKKEMLSVAATMLDCKAEELDAADGIVFMKNKPDDPKVSTRDVAKYVVTQKGTLISGYGLYADETAPEGGRTKAFATYIPTYAYGCQAIEVEVDQETGKVEILKITALTDSGRTLNPLLAEGQIHGALAQGLGYAFTEEYVIDEGKVLTDSFVDYKVPRAEDMPEMVLDFIESNDLGPYGVKGIGESGLVPTQAALANAVYQATGVLIKELPVKPEKVLKGLKQRGLC